MRKKPDKSKVNKSGDPKRGSSINPFGKNPEYKSKVKSTEDLKKASLINEIEKNLNKTKVKSSENLTPKPR